MLLNYLFFRKMTVDNTAQFVPATRKLCSHGMMYFQSNKHHAHDNEKNE